MKINLFGIVRWIVGLLFALVALGFLIDGAILAFLLSLLIAIICIPVIAAPIENKLNLKLSGLIRFFIVFILFIGFGLVAPPADPASDDVKEVAQTNEYQTFEEQLSAELKNAPGGIEIDPSNIHYDKNTKEISIELGGSPELVGNEMYRRAQIKRTFGIMSVLVKHPGDIYMISFYSMLPTIDTHGNEENTLVYSALTTMDDARNVNWDKLKEYPDPEAALGANFAYEFSPVVR